MTYEERVRTALNSAALKHAYGMPFSTPEALLSEYCAYLVWAASVDVTQMQFAEWYAQRDYDEAEAEL